MRRNPVHPTIEALLGAYALDAVDGDEGQRVNDHLVACPRCRAEVAGYHEVAGLLGNVGQEAPAGLWERIVAGLEEAPPALRLGPVADEPSSGTAAREVGGSACGGAGVEVGAGAEGRLPGAGGARGGTGHHRRRRGLQAAGAVLAAAAAAVIAVLGFQVASLDHRLNAVSSQMAPSMAAVRAALAQPGTRQLALRSPGGAPLAKAVIESEGTGYLYATDLRPLPQSETYQLWGVVGGSRISYGVLGPAPGVQVFRASRGVSALAITAEPAGGVVSSSHPPVAVGSLPSAS